MKNKSLFLLFLVSALSACGQKAGEENPATFPLETPSTINLSGETIAERFPTPEGFNRIETTPNSFAEYLRQFPLHPSNSPVHLFNGRLKSRQDVHAAVLKIDVGTNDLQQCADAIMRLRAEYLFHQNRFEEIHFNFTNGFRADYSEWQKGKRIKVYGNKCSWQQTAAPSNNYEDFRAYLDLVFMYAGTLSLSKELRAADIQDLKIGDVFIQGGSPGHAVLVVDAAIQPQTGGKIFLLAQSYMPAQEVHVLKNLADEKLSPWFSADFGAVLRTPEWEFKKADLKRF